MCTNPVFVQPTCLLRHMFVRQRLAPEQAHAEQTHGWPLFHVRPVHVSVASTCGCCDVVVMWAQDQACCAFCAPTEALVGGEWCSGQFRAACSTAHRWGLSFPRPVWCASGLVWSTVEGWWQVGGRSVSWGRGFWSVGAQRTASQGTLQDCTLPGGSQHC